MADLQKSTMKNWPQIPPPQTPKQTFARACWWLAQGVHIVPLQPNSKRLVAGFGPWREHIETIGEARDWFTAGAFNLGVLPGTGNLVGVDFDNVTVFEPWLDGHPEVKTLVESSSRPGRGHVFLFDAVAVNAVSVGLEIKARVCVVTVAPSVVDGRSYVVLRDAPILRANVSELFSLPSVSASSRPMPAPVAPLYSSLRSHGVHDDLIARIKRARPIFDLAHDLLVSTGGLHSSDGGRGRWFAGRCPFHKDQHPSFWLDVQEGRFGCHASACIAQRGGDVVNLYALIHGLDNRDALIELARSLL